MFNPFEKFRAAFIDGFRKAGKQYLVSQTYQRGKDPFDESTRTALLLSQYDTLSHAQIHLSAIKDDKYAAIIDLENEKHREKIKDMLMPDSPYIVFSILIPDKNEMDKRLFKKFEQKIRRYIDNKTTWRIPASDTVNSVLDIAFGELFILLKWRNNQLRLKLDDLEKA
ncbi:MAG TPA: hypothetical protein VMI35_13565 [Puia sp.]|nr:hypothetical protein [Puia sp.]